MESVFIFFWEIRKRKIRGGGEVLFVFVLIVLSGVRIVGRKNRKLLNWWFFNGKKKKSGCFFDSLMGICFLISVDCN